MFTYTVRPDGGEPYVVTATMRDVLRWERTSPKGRLPRKAEDLGTASAENAYSLAYVASKRQGRFAGTEQEFEETVDINGGDQLTEPADEPAGEEGEGPDPTPSDR